MQQKEVILEGTIKAFNEKGLKFTMDDVAKILGMSKRPYIPYSATRSRCFLRWWITCSIPSKESEQQIVEDDALSTVEKIRRILGVIPESYRDVDFRQLYLLKDKYPVIYKQVEKDWRPAGRQRSSFWSREWRKAWSARSAFRSVKMMLEATVEQFFQRDILIQSGLFLSGSASMRWFRFW